MKKLWTIIGRVLWIFVCIPVKIITPYTVRTRVVISSGQEILLCKDWLGSGKWSLPGGGVRKGEDLIKGAIREVKEETGLILKPEQLKPINLPKSSHRRSKYHFFTVIYSEKPAVQKRSFFDEITDIKWVSTQVIKDKKIVDVLTAVQSVSNQ